MGLSSSSLSAASQMISGPSASANPGHWINGDGNEVFKNVRPQLVPKTVRMHKSRQTHMLEGSHMNESRRCQTRCRLRSPSTTCGTKRSPQVLEIQTSQRSLLSSSRARISPQLMQRLTIKRISEPIHPLIILGRQLEIAVH